MIQGRQDRAETNASLLLRARWLVDRIHLRLIILGDITGALQINTIINAIDTERQRWLSAVESPIP